MVGFSAAAAVPPRTPCRAISQPAPATTRASPSMSKSLYPATLTLPKLDEPYPSLLDFLAARFPRMGRACWQRRLAEGKVLDESGCALSEASGYHPFRKILYFREVEEERIIPFPEKILFQNREIVVACKPHFLPVTPIGRFVEQSLLHRLRIRTGNDQLVPIHRLDRHTAGIVMFSANRATTHLYCRLFKEGEVEKRYEALSMGAGETGEVEWLVENRIVSGDPFFRMRVASGEANARSRIRLVAEREGLRRFLLSPLTGKTHQLRLHMSGLGFSILNDRCYPELLPEQPDDFGRPLQLVAKSLKFRDPVTGASMEFESERKLLW
jgi:tRNA pseudouridine32 synthase / 23S rRNA pseudouridine746 synthase